MSVDLGNAIVPNCGKFSISGFKNNYQEFDNLLNCKIAFVLIHRDKLRKNRKVLGNPSSHKTRYMSIENNNWLSKKLKKHPCAKNVQGVRKVFW